MTVMGLPCAGLPRWMYPITMALSCLARKREDAAYVCYAESVMEGARRW